MTGPELRALIRKAQNYDLAATLVLLDYLKEQGDQFRADRLHLFIGQAIADCERLNSDMNEYDRNTLLEVARRRYRDSFTLLFWPELYPVPREIDRLGRALRGTYVPDEPAPYQEDVTGS